MKFKTLVLAFALALVVGVVPSPAHAANPFSTIQFPIADLGGCASQADCRAYCDITENAPACHAWAEANGLAPKTPPKNPTQSAIERILKEKPGPGGCTTPNECKTYCADTAHQEECVAFAKEHRLLSKADEAKVKLRGRLDALIAAGKGPGACADKEACKVYCQDPAHRDACIAFAKEAGVINQEQGERMRNLPKAGPGGCASPQACAAFCAEEANHNACISFAKENMLPRGMGSTTPRGDERRMLPPRPFMNNVGSTTRAYPNPGMGTSTMPRPPFIRDGKTMTGSTTPPGLRQGMPGQGPGVRYPDNEDQQGGSGDNRSGQPLPKRPFPPPPPGFGPTPADGQDGTQSMGDTIVSGMTASAISAFTRGVSWMFRF